MGRSNVGRLQLTATILGGQNKMGYRHKKVGSIIVMVSTILWLVGLSTLSVFAQGAGREWEILNQEIARLLDAEEYDRAIVVAKKALEIAEKNVGPDHLDVAKSLVVLAGLYHIHGQYTQAEPLMKRGKAIMEKAIEPDHPKAGHIKGKVTKIAGDMVTVKDAGGKEHMLHVDAKTTKKGGEIKVGIHVEADSDKSGHAKSIKVEAEMSPKLGTDDATTRSTTLQNTETSMKAPMSKPELAQMYRDYLQREGYSPEIDKDDDVTFKKDELTYYILINEKDPEFFNLVLPGIWSIDNDGERAKVEKAILHTISQTKVAKLYILCLLYTSPSPRD